MMKADPLVGGNGNVNYVSRKSVADILERELDATIQDWLRLVEKVPELSRIPLNFEERTGRLPKLVHDVIVRLRVGQGENPRVSVAALQHGELRRKQGYTVAMVVDESRILQAAIFATLHRYENCIKVSTLLPDIVIIADEVDAQLKQQVLCFMAADEPREPKAN